MKSFFKRSTRFVAFFILTVYCFFGGYACENVGVYDSATLSAFNGTPIIVNSFGTALSDDIISQMNDCLTSLNAEFSATLKTSSVYALNCAKAGEKIAVSERFKNIFDECLYMHRTTNGKFDISVYPLSLLWHFSPDYPIPDFSVPDSGDISAALISVGADKFDISNTYNGFAFKTDDNAKIDLGGALKGLAAEDLAEILRANGATGGYVNCGNSSLYIISADALSIKHPKKPENIVKITKKLKDVSVSTSGDYQKTYSFNGKNYSHIIDPATGKPAETNVSSATVVGKNGLKTDALSTALCLFSHDPDNFENSELINYLMSLRKTDDFNDISFYIVYDDGEKKQVISNEKQGENFTLLDNGYTVYSV